MLDLSQPCFVKRVCSAVGEMTHGKGRLGGQTWKQVSPSSDKDSDNCDECGCETER
jgi:hypothetical protein